jgi:hypothetical protein
MDGVSEFYEPLFCSTICVLIDKYLYFKNNYYTPWFVTGLSRRGLARRGLVRLGAAGSGTVRFGKARFFGTAFLFLKRKN